MNSRELKLLRLELELTQKEISKLVEVSDKAWNQWEIGNVEMHASYKALLEKNIKQCYGIELDVLLRSKDFFEKMMRYNQKDIKLHGDELARKTHAKDYLAPSSSFTFIDLFAGIGGIRQAFESVGGRCIFSSEIDVFAKYTYYANFGVVPYGDITKINAQDIPDHDVLCAGFPCQPFSHIGKREGFEHPTQGTMFYEIVRILMEKKPQIVFLENVPGLVNHDDGNTLKTIISTLKEIGYKVDTTILDANNFGVPQKRRRFYLIGRLDHKTNFQFPKEPMTEVDIGTIVESGVNGYSISEHLQKAYLFKKNDGKPLVIDQNTKGSIKTLVSTYHKIQRLTGTFVRDGETGLRLLSENECKAVMGFSKDFKIPVSRTQMYRQMGNSVVIPVVRAIASEVKSILMRD